MAPVELTRLLRVRHLTGSGRARAIRLGCGLSQAEVAGAVGVSPACVWMWEARRRVPHGPAAERYERVLALLEGVPATATTATPAAGG